MPNVILYGRISFEEISIHSLAVECCLINDKKMMGVDLFLMEFCQDFPQCDSRFISSENANVRLVLFAHIVHPLGPYLYLAHIARAFFFMAEGERF